MTMSAKPNARTTAQGVRDKNAATTAAARVIIDEEVRLRKAKTDRLRRLRMEREAAEAKPEPAAKKTAAKKPAAGKTAKA